MPLQKIVLALGLTIISAASTADSNSILRGKYLFDGADCYGCHMTPRGSANDAITQNRKLPSGGLGLDTPFGTFRTPNITPDQQYGIGNWSKEDFKRALRNGIGRHGEYLYPAFTFTSFTKLSDHDVDDLYDYMMSLPTVPLANKTHELKFPFSWRPLLAFWRTLFFTPGPMAADLSHDPNWNRGNYLVHAVAHCEECHTPRNVLGALKTSKSFSGNIGGPDKQNAPNITSDVQTGIGSWSISDIELLLKTGMTPDSDLVGSGMKAVVQGTSQLTDEDRHAIAVYLKSVPPIHVDLPAPNPLMKN